MLEKINVFSNSLGIFTLNDDEPYKDGTIATPKKKENR